VALFKKAAARPGAPSMIKRREAHVVYMKDDLSHAYAMWMEIYKNAKSIIERDAGFKHLYQIKFEMDKKMLENKLEIYKQQYGRYPMDLSYLVRAGLLKKIPLDFSGKRYIYNPEEGKIKAIRMFEWKRR
jgi:hypothetical protein